MPSAWSTVMQENMVCYLLTGNTFKFFSVMGMKMCISLSLTGLLMYTDSLVLLSFLQCIVCRLILCKYIFVG